MKAKKNTLCIFMLLISFSACLRDNITNLPGPQPQGDKYVGEIQNATEYIDDNMNIFISIKDTMKFSFHMDETRYFALPSESGLCTDLITISSDSINFKSNISCPCRCECDPLIDCLGFPLAGNWKYSELADTLIFERKSGLFPNLYPEIGFPNHIFTRYTSKGVFVKTID